MEVAALFALLGAAVALGIYEFATDPKGTLWKWLKEFAASASKEIDERAEQERQEAGNKPKEWTLSK